MPVRRTSPRKPSTCLSHRPPAGARRFTTISTSLQDHIHSIHNTETRTPSYTLWNASAGTDIHIRGKKLLSVALTAQNIFNRAYQHHLSRLKEAGIYNMGRNIGVKVAVPITL